MALSTRTLPLCALRLPALSVVALLLAGCGSSGSHSTASTGEASGGTTTTATLSSGLFDFGQNFVGNPVSHTVATVTNTGSATLEIGPWLGGNSGFSLDAVNSCPRQLAPNSTCPIVVQYSPLAVSAGGLQTAQIKLNFGNVAPGTPGTISLTGTALQPPIGTVAATANPQVALYSIALPYAASVRIDFGQDTTYALSTWTQSTPAGGGTVAIQVAGMLANTRYHMRAFIQLANGAAGYDTDHVFTTGSLPAAYQQQVLASTTSGLTPQPGVELMSTTNGIGAFATDLAGNVIWTYPFPDRQDDSLLLPVNLLPNGHLLVLIGLGLDQPVSSPASSTAFSAIREIDLVGNTIRQITVQQANQALANATSGDYDFLLANFSHEIIQLPNGHWLTLGSTVKPFTDLPGYPGVTNVIGDTLIDLDQNLQPAWVWNSFDHLDVNRHPMMFPDWTHANAIAYSRDDGNLLVSLRHQNWILKLDYRDGAGTGNILWKLGYQGDFQLVGGTDPTDWFYAQHDPAFFSSNTTGVFQLGIMDNGDDRVFPAGVNCSNPGTPPCQFTTIPVLSIDENARTATFISHQILDPSLYSFFGGSVDLLANGNIEYDLCGLAGQPSSHVFEVTPGANPQTVWQLELNTAGVNIYRALRIPSLYPGVQWNNQP